MQEKEYINLRELFIFSLSHHKFLHNIPELTQMGNCSVIFKGLWDLISNFMEII